MHRQRDSVRATPEGIRVLHDSIRDRVWKERQQQREEGREPTYSRHDVAEQAGVSIDTVKRLLRGNRVMRDCADAISRSLGLELSDIIEPSRSQLPSNFYVERPPFEAQCYEEICSQQGALIRIKAPHCMGKTWFVSKLLYQLKKQRYRAVTLSFREAEHDVFTDLRTFLQWFCANVSSSLDLPGLPEEKWSDVLGNNSSCTDYFEKYILEGINKPLVLILDDVDLVFEQSEIANDFCNLLRSWHEKAKRHGTIWRKLRLVIVHSTDVYGALDINRSPLNVGTVFPLRQFYLNEVTSLVQQYNFPWQTDEIEKFMALLGGNPYLVHEALNYLRLRPEMTLNQLLHNPVTDIGPYHNYLGELSSILHQNPSLAATFNDVVNATIPVRIDSAHQFQLCSMGLVELKEEGVVPSCELYRRYFRDRLLPKPSGKR